MNKIYFNFWHLKAKNGMFYFLADYADALSSEFDCIFLVRKGRFNKSDFPKFSDVLELGVIKYFIFCFVAILQRPNIFSASIHAIPFVKSQVVTLHDSFPFQTPIKQAILFLMLKASRSKIGTINETVNVEFLTSLRLKHDFILPNILPSISRKFKKSDTFAREDILRIGLCGTDSKKNYGELFDEIDNFIECGGASVQKLSVFVFGANTPYLSRVLEQDRNFEFEFIDSQKKSLVAFLEDDIDILISVATNEGFCRPIALAVLLQKPIILINDPVFKEFYHENAVFFESIPELVADLPNYNRVPIGNSREFELRNASKVKLAIKSLKAFFGPYL